MLKYQIKNQHFFTGIFVLGCAHAILANKTGHLSIHGSMAESKTINNIINYVVVEFMSFFSAEAGYDIHIKGHHPHTNIIGLGDSSYVFPRLSFSIMAFLRM